MNDSGVDDVHAHWGLDRQSFMARHAASAKVAPNGDSADGSPTAGNGIDAAQGRGASPSYVLDHLVAPDGESFTQSRKIPRGLHLWFAVALGVLTVILVFAQGFVARTNRDDGKAKQQAPHDSDLAPSLQPLQREIARQRGNAPIGDIFGALPAGSARTPRRAHLREGSDSPLFGLAEARESARQAGAPTEEMNRLRLSSESGPRPPAGVEADLPPDLLNSVDLDEAHQYEEDKAHGVIAGSHILAINHAPATIGMDPLVPEAFPGDSSMPAKLLQWLNASPQLMRGVAGAVSQISASAASDGDGLAGSRERIGVPERFEARNALQPRVTPSPAALRARPAAARLLLQEGTAIPCVLLTEVRSDLPGMVVAQVSEDVFDSVHADTRLLPRGTRVIGRYDTQIAGGQQRLLASFHRLILPDASSVDLGRMDAADIAGGAGLQDEVDTHFWGRFGQAFLTAGLARAAQHPGGAVTVSGVGGVLPGPDATGQILVDTARTSLQAGIQLAPTLIIRRGFPFQVMVNRDIALEAAP